MEMFKYRYRLRARVIHVAERYKSPNMRTISEYLVL